MPWFQSFFRFVAPFCIGQSSHQQNIGLKKIPLLKIKQPFYHFKLAKLFTTSTRVQALTIDFSVEFLCSEVHIWAGVQIWRFRYDCWLDFRALEFTGSPCGATWYPVWWKSDSPVVAELSTVTRSTS